VTTYLKEKWMWHVMCVMCGRLEESIQHLFFICTVIERLWQLCDKWVGIVMAHQNIQKKKKTLPIHKLKKQKK